MTSSLMRSPAMSAGKSSEAPLGPVGLEPALDLRDVDAELALPRLEPFLADGEQVLAALDLLLAQLEVGLEDGAAGLEVALALVQLADALPKRVLELGDAPLTAIQALARLHGSQCGPVRLLELADALLARLEIGLGRAETRLTLLELAHGDRKTGRALVRTGVHSPEVLEILDLDLEDGREDGSGRSPAATTPDLLPRRGRRVAGVPVLSHVGAACTRTMAGGPRRGIPPIGHLVADHTFQGSRQGRPAPNGPLLVFLDLTPAARVPRFERDAATSPDCPPRRGEAEPGVPALTRCPTAANPVSRACLATVQLSCYRWNADSGDDVARVLGVENRPDEQVRRDLAPSLLVVGRVGQVDDELRGADRARGEARAREVLAELAEELGVPDLDRDGPQFARSIGRASCVRKPCLGLFLLATPGRGRPRDLRVRATTGPTRRLPSRTARR